MENRTYVLLVLDVIRFSARNRHQCHYTPTSNQRKQHIEFCTTIVRAHHLFPLQAIAPELFNQATSLHSAADILRHITFNPPSKLAVWLQKLVAGIWLLSGSSCWYVSEVTKPGHCKWTHKIHSFVSTVSAAIRNLFRGPNCQITVQPVVDHVYVRGRISYRIRLGEWVLISVLIQPFYLYLKRQLSHWVRTLFIFVTQ